MDKQMIEEMARDFADPTYGCIQECTSCKECILEGECIVYKYAVAAYNAGYRKIPEGALVLTKEEYKKWLEFVISYLILFVCEHRRGLGEDALWQPNEDEREKIPLDLDNMFKKIVEGK